MSRRVWEGAKHQLCWWHQCEAVKRRLKGALPTSVYNVRRARREFPFIDPGFKPHGRADPKDSEGSVPGEIREPESEEETLAHTSGDPNAIRIRIPAQPIPPQSPELSPACNDLPTLTIRIPALSNVRGTEPTSDDESDKEITNERRTFCPLELRAGVVDLMECHFCAHPFIPGYSAPTPEGIKAWAVKQAYEFCVHHELPNLWAYLWENWYRRGRWELWARCGNPEAIPRLKTTMIVEAHWRHIKEDYLHHFSFPRLDLLVWVLVTKLVPSYYRK
ncbi:hypothetical protein CPB84DRAFT_1714242, partial [Gymnopilus junonius]